MLTKFQIRDSEYAWSMLIPKQCFFCLHWYISGYCCISYKKPTNWSVQQIKWQVTWNAALGWNGLSIHFMSSGLNKIKNSDWNILRNNECLYFWFCFYWLILGHCPVFQSIFIWISWNITSMYVDTKLSISSKSISCITVLDVSFNFRWSV